MPRSPTEVCELTWDERPVPTISGGGGVGDTTVSGNLPTHRTKECVEDIVDLGDPLDPSSLSYNFSWVTIRDFHFYHFKCPYSTVSDAVNYVRNEDRGDPNYWNYELVMPAYRSAHVATGGMMIKHIRGSKNGWLCVDPACTYYLGTTALGTTTSGLNYFYY